MMLSVIPARLQFQCGHAALVTLPRVKGETATQRNDRVAREKTAALTRQCDFCAPSVAVLEPQVAAVNGNHAEVAPTDVVELTPVAALGVEAPEQSETPSPAEDISPEADVEAAISPVEPLVADIVEPEQGAVEIPQEVVDEAIVATHTEDAPAAEDKPARKPRARRQTTPPRPARRQAARRQPARRQPAPAAVSTQRFVVEYQVERVLRGSDVHDVLRQLSAQGAADVLAVIRED
jgi:hypothetical protein